MNLGLRNILLPLLLILSIVSCRRDRAGLADTDTSIAQKYSSIEQSNNDLDAIATEVVNTKGTSLKTDDINSMLSSCATVTLHYSTNDSLNASINFGTSNCLCNDQKYRRGIIKILYSKNKANVKLNTENYYVNNNKIDATRSLQYVSSTYFVITSTTSVLFADSSQTVTESSTRTINWIEGNSTSQDKSDDVFVVSGSGSGTNHDGVAYTVNITSPLYRAGSCSYIKKGVVEIKPANKLARKIDFGEGACDNLATLSIGKFSKIIALK